MMIFISGIPNSTANKNKYHCNDEFDSKCFDIRNCWQCHTHSDILSFGTKYFIGCYLKASRKFVFANGLLCVFYLFCIFTYGFQYSIADKCTDELSYHVDKSHRQINMFVDKSSQCYCRVQMSS